MNPHVYPAFLLTFVNVLGFSLLLPVLPFVVEQYGGSKAVYGALLSSYSIFQALGAPYHKLSDIGRRFDDFSSGHPFVVAHIWTGLLYSKHPILGLAVPLVSLPFHGFSMALPEATMPWLSHLTDITTKNHLRDCGRDAGIGLIIGQELEATSLQVHTATGHGCWRSLPVYSNAH